MKESVVAVVVHGQERRGAFVNINIKFKYKDRDLAVAGVLR